MFEKLKFGALIGTCFLSLLFISCPSCTNTKKATYFNGAQPGSIVSNTPIPESIIQKNDILNITVSSLNPEASAFFNTSSGGSSAGGTAPGAESSKSGGYLVSSDGYIQFPLLGNIKAEGLTKNQLKEKITQTILEKKLLVDPIVIIRFQNFRVTVLGEVNNPTVVSVPNEKISLLEAIGLAGDLTLYAKRDNVMLIREQKDPKTGSESKLITRLNLNTSEIFTSPYYYLQSNDIVYVEPGKARVATTNRSNTWIPLLFSGLSLTIILIDQFSN